MKHKTGKMDLKTIDSRGNKIVLKNVKCTIYGRERCVDPEDVARAEIKLCKSEIKKLERLLKKYGSKDVGK